MKRRPASRLNEVWAVWLLFGTVAVFVFITYWRLPPAVLWKTTNTGFVGGAGRAFVFISFSAALAAIATLPIVTDRLANRRAYFLGAVALVLCATVAHHHTMSPSAATPATFAATSGPTSSSWSIPSPTGATTRSPDTRAAGTASWCAAWTMWCGRRRASSRPIA